MATITIDGTEYTVSDGLTVVQAAAEVGITIPHYCYHPALAAPANCRMCLIELTPPGAPGPGRQLATACTTRVADGMAIGCESPRVKAARATTLEFLLAHHPLDCPTCDQAGECDLQDFVFKFGHGKSRYTEEKQVPPRKNIGAHVDLFSTRCVVCTRCIRFCDEVTGTSDIQLINRGVQDEIDVYPGKPLDNKMSGNVVDICPVGALVSRDFLYRSRPWFLDKTPSVCPGCSKGCDIHVESREGEIARLKPRYNQQVNGFWMCDDGRYGCEFVNDSSRLAMPMLRDGDDLVPTGWTAAFATIAERLQELGPESVAVVASAWGTNEDLLATKRLAEEALRTTALGLLARPIADEDVVYPGFVIERDKNPNRTGAKLILGDDVAEDEALWQLLRGVRGAIILAGVPELIISDDARAALQSLEFLAVVDILPSDLTAAADVVMPGSAFSEKEGCFTNSQKRVQRLSRATPLLGNAIPEWEAMAHLAGELGTEIAYATVNDVTDDLATRIKAFAQAKHTAIGPQGLLLGDGGEASDDGTLTGDDAYAAMFWQ